MMVILDGYSWIEFLWFFIFFIIVDYWIVFVNVFGYLCVMFIVEDIDEMVLRFIKYGVEFVGEVV